MPFSIRSRKFLSTPSARRATFSTSEIVVSYPFLSTPSARRATSSFCAQFTFLRFLSTPSARRATAVHGPEDLVDTISIHALREEGDSVTSASATRTADFYPRPPRGGRPSPNRGPSEANNQFLSTPSARRATWCVSPGNTSSRYFYPRPPRGGRPRLRPHLQRVVQISIHALREEGDRSNRL